MKAFLNNLLPAFFVFFAVFIAGVEFAALVPPVTTYNAAAWKPIVSLLIAAGVFFSYFWPPRRAAASSVRDSEGEK